MCCTSFLVNYCSSDEVPMMGFHYSVQWIVLNCLSWCLHELIVAHRRRVCFSWYVVMSPVVLVTERLLSEAQHLLLFVCIDVEHSWFRCFCYRLWRYLLGGLYYFLIVDLRSCLFLWHQLRSNTLTNECDSRYGTRLWYFYRRWWLW